jgi:ribokinase/sulfofructose kinase
MIVFCGYANRDITIALDVLPVSGERRHARSIRQYDGGMAANAAVAAARFGSEPMFAGAVGSDAQSAAFLATLQNEGVSTSWTRTDGYLTHAVVLLDGTGERAVISEDDALTRQDLQHVLERLDPAEQHWVYVDGYRWGSRWLPQTRASLVVDVDGCTSPGQVLHAARAARHLLGSSRTFSDTCGFTSESLDQLAAAEGTTVIVTRGAQGLIVFEPGLQAQHIPAVPVTAVDDTGAGDCFAGVYMAELARGQSAIEAASTGTAAAAKSCLHPGARTSPTREELTGFLATYTSTPSGHRH